MVSCARSDDHGAVPPSSASTVRSPDPDVVTELLRQQAPELAHLPVRLSATSGSSNWVFRLGDRWAVRMPRTDDYASDLLNEVRWLPRLVGHLPVPVPTVVAAGTPSELFARPWAVVTWVPGETPTVLDAAQQETLALSLGGFLASLHAVDTTGAPTGDEHWGYRCGEPVTDRIDEWADGAANDLADLFDPAAVRGAWRRLRDVPAATQRACLVHTDLSAENLLADPDGRLAGVIDFGALGVGDRSVDFLYAWSMLEAPAREVLRTCARVDDETWARARAWAFVGPGLLTIASYRDSMPTRAQRLTTMVERVAAEVGVRLR